MKLWILESIGGESRQKSENQQVSYRLTVRAQDERMARMVAARVAGDEGKSHWWSAAHSRCTEMDPWAARDIAPWGAEEVLTRENDRPSASVHQLRVAS